MNRGTILNLVFKQCRDEGTRGGVGELLVRGQGLGTKRRSVFIADVTEDELHRIREQATDTLGQHHPYYDAITYWHGTVEAPSYNEELSLTDNRLENNWRCRLVANHQIDFTEQHQFYNLVMKATWRIIVTQRGGEYFVRRDIFPFLWSPGHSVGGFDQFEKGVRREVGYLADPNIGTIDEQNDIVKGFAGFHGQQFQDLIPGGIQIQELRADQDRHTNQILDAFRNHFQHP